jgi:uncharacterized protein (DUF2141 family)
LPLTASLPHCLTAALLWLAAFLPPLQTASGSLTGQVIDATNGQRLTGVTVSIAGGGLKAAVKTVTDSDGQFHFTALERGTYAVEARRGGYLDGAFGRRRPGGPPKPVHVEDDEQRQGVTIELFKPAAITGTITDDVGEPVVRVEVRAYRRAFSGGRPVVAEVMTDLTDDRGVYRLTRLEPGDYVVAAPLTQGDTGSSIAHLPRAEGRAQKFPTVYFPAAATAAQAGLITLAQGELRRAVDIQLRPAKVFTLSGAAVSQTGPARGVDLALVAVGEDDVAGNRAVARTVTSLSGTFVLPGIPAGEYVLRALLLPKTKDDTDPPLWAEQQISVGEKDIAEIALNLRSGPRVAGRIAIDGSSDDTAQRLTGLTISLDPAGLRYAGAPDPAAAIDLVGRSFVLPHVLPGRYLVRATAPGGWMLKSVTYQGRDVSQTPFTVDQSDAAGLVVTLTDRPTMLAGLVTGVGDISESQVLVFPQDPQAWRDIGSAPLAVRTASVSDMGGFEIRGLPVGDYLIVACNEETALDWQSPDFLAAAARVATRVRVSDGVMQSVDLKIVEIK